MIDRATTTSATGLQRMAAAIGACVLMIVGGLVAIGVTPIEGARAEARSDYGAVARYVFVPSGTVPTVTVIDRISDTVVGTLDVGLVPNQLVVSEAAGKLVAVDGASQSASVIDLASGRRISIELGFVPRRLIVSPDGYLAAVADPSGGTVAFISLMRLQVASRIAGLSPIRDLMFGADGAFLYLTAERLNGVGVVDVARGKLIEDILIPGLRPSDAVGLTRSPSGRMGYVKGRGNETMGLFDLNNFRAIRELAVGRQADKAFPTGFGGYVVVPDNSEHSVTIIANASLTVAAMLKGAPGMSAVYSGWFDTLALIPSTAERKLLVYDLDRLGRASDVPLPGTPRAGAVTPEGTKLYLALDDADQVAVVDLQTRKLARTIAVGERPVSAVMGKSFDVCH